MPSRILLVSANRCAAPDPVFPIGLAHLSAALRDAGHECAWLDCLADRGRFEELLSQSQADYACISLRNIDDVIIRKQETFFDELAALVERLRQQLKCPVVLGGSGFSIFPEALLTASGADFGIVGEGEASLVALVKALELGKEYTNVPGLVFRSGEQVIINPRALVSSSCSMMGQDRPARLLDFYQEMGCMMNVQTQRGCAFSCCYCTYPLIEGRRHRRRSASAVAEEFAQLQRLGAKYVFIVDSVFNTSPDHVAGICEALLQRKVDLPWGCFLRPQGLTVELMRLMTRAGLKHIEFGSDSFCDAVLVAYGKGFGFEDIKRSSELARAEELDFCHYLIAGGPGETTDTLKQGFRNAQGLTGAVVLAVVGMRIYPGTRLHQQAVAEGVLAPEANLLRPKYYLSPGLKQEQVFATLEGFARRSPNWIVGDPDPGYEKFVNRLRLRGVVGPLWSYFSMLQRLGPVMGPKHARTA